MLPTYNKNLNISKTPLVNTAVAPLTFDMDKISFLPAHAASVYMNSIEK